MTEIAPNHHRHYIRSPNSNPSRRQQHCISEIESILKSDNISTASTTSVTPISPDSPSSSLAFPAQRNNATEKTGENRNEVETNKNFKIPSVITNHPNQFTVSVLKPTDSSNQPTSTHSTTTTKQHLLRPKAQVFTADEGEPINPVLETKSLNQSTTTTLNTNNSSTKRVGPQAVAPAPIVVRPAPLKNNGKININIPNTTVQVLNQKIVVEARLQQQDEEYRKKLFRQQQQLQQREEAVRLKEEQLLRIKKQQNQCSFPTVPARPANSKTSATNNRPIAHPMGSTDRSNPSQVMNKPQQNYVLRPSSRSNSSNIPSEKHMLPNHNNVMNHPTDSMDSSNHPTPLFERLVTEEVQELKTYIRIVETLNRRLVDMQSLQDDLESRLEKSTKEKLDMESRLVDLNNNWLRKCSNLEGERDTWAKRCGEERGRNERLSDLINRKDKEIQRMIQRKVRE